MTIIIRNRNKNIEVSNITSKEEMVWIQPEQFEQITTDAGTMATEFMRKHPQIHEVKFSVLPQMDDEEDEEQFYGSEEEDLQPTDGDGQHHCGHDAATEQEHVEPKA